MQRDYELPGGETIRQRLLRDHAVIHALLDDQVLERLPNGELAWLRLDPHRVRIIEDGCAPQPDPDERFTITDIGRRTLRMAELFGTEA